MSYCEYSTCLSFVNRSCQLYSSGSFTLTLWNNTALCHIRSAAHAALYPNQVQLEIHRDAHIYQLNITISRYLPCWLPSTYQQIGWHSTMAVADVFRLCRRLKSRALKLTVKNLNEWAGTRRIQWFFGRRALWSRCCVMRELQTTDVQSSWQQLNMSLGWTEMFLET